MRETPFFAFEANISLAGALGRKYEVIDVFSLLRLGYFLNRLAGWLANYLIEYLCHGKCLSTTYESSFPPSSDVLWLWNQLNGAVCQGQWSRLLVMTVRMDDFRSFPLWRT